MVFLAVLTTINQTTIALRFDACGKEGKKGDAKAGKGVLGSMNADYRKLMVTLILGAGLSLSSFISAVRCLLLM